MSRTHRGCEVPARRKCAAVAAATAATSTDSPSAASRLASRFGQLDERFLTEHAVEELRAVAVADELLCARPEQPALDS